MGRKTKTQHNAAAARAANARAYKIAALPVYTPPAIISYTGQIRDRQLGEEFSVHSFNLDAVSTSADSLAAKVTGVWRAKSSRLTVLCQGVVRPAFDVLQAAGLGRDPADFLADGMDKLAAYAKKTDPEFPHPLIFGEDNPGTAKKPKALLSEAERLTRVVEAVATGVGELYLRGHRVADLFSDRMIPATAAFMRKHITWDGKENGTVFELVSNWDLTRFALRSGLPPTYGIMMPGAKTGSRSLKLGYDAGLLGLEGLLVAFQAKAIALAKLAATAGLSVQKSSSGEYYLRLKCGNEVLRQAFEDGVRIRPWGHMLPNRDIITELPSPSVPWNASRPGWWRVHPVTIFRFSSDQAIAEAYEAVFHSRHAGSQQLPIVGVGLPLSLVEEMQNVFNGNTIRGDMPFHVFAAGVREALDKAVPKWEAFVNGQLEIFSYRKQMVDINASPEGHWTIDTFPQVRIVASHQDTRLQQVLVEANLLNLDGG